MTYHVLVPDNVHPSALDILNAADGLHITAPGQMNRAELLAALPDADALIIRSASKIDAEALAATSKLKMIARAGVGVDNVDIPDATKRC